MKKNLFAPAALLCLATLLTASPLLAGAFSFKAFSGDADSGISTTKTYTHAVDINGQTPGVVVNGVPLTQGGLLGGNYTMSFDTGPNSFTGYGSGISGNMGTAMSDFFYSPNPAAPEHLLLSGLTPGKSYTTSFYVAGFGGDLQTMVASDYPVATPLIPRDGGTAPGGIISYTYIAPVSGTLNFDITGSTGSFHQYAFTNQLNADVPLAGIYSTGVNNSSVPQANATTESHWAVQNPNLNCGVAYSPIVATQAFGFPIPPWLVDNTTSAWVGPAGDLIGPGDNIPYTYTLNFTTPGSGLVTIGGLAAADNAVTGVFIDGVAGQFKDFGFENWASFLASVNVVGTNHTLSFTMTNADLTAGLTGFRADIGYAGFTAVPEPSTLALLGLGAVGLFVAGLRRRA